MVDMLVAQRDAIRILQANPSISIQPETDTAPFDAMREAPSRFSNVAVADHCPW
ncbi:hypothetical protein C8250_038840 [Streptomyces sp. So13.3]|uniref:hypothetical protein n=1 Tax=Streptomyces TaxID=1883 RepID=UPI00164EC4D5|nr:MULTISPECIES: hypothetical protein [Streptomyces]MCZ4103801.1 hypothetical protein [Streptomyces sp. H39-C1]QNA77033.1 hypothetical protein C8250_038840 [Streptomyces sp. So13.3]